MQQDSLHQIRRYIKDCGENAPKLHKILDDHKEVLSIAQGSLYNHQAWPGGYLVHVVDTLEYAQNIYSWELDFPFSWSSVVLVSFVHDLEKPFMYLDMVAKDDLTKSWTKAERKHFRIKLIEKYGISLTNEEQIALNYVEGEGSDYRQDKRVMNELGALCHAADVLSARLCHSRKKPDVK